MFKLGKAIIASTVIIMVGAVAIPSAASAATLWVSNATPSAPYNSCTNTGYTSIQAALKYATPHSTINVCGGTYEEQLEIKAPVSLIGTENPVVKLPASPAKSETACDAARNAAVGGEDQDLISICTTGSIVVKGLTFEAKWPGNTCDDSLYGILVAGARHSTPPM